MHHRNHFEEWTAEWWYFVGGLFLLLPADLLTTLVAVSRYGIEAEANPIMRWLLSRGLFTVTIVHLAVTAVVVSAFAAVLTLSQTAQPPHDAILDRLIAVWLWLILVAGVVLVANNLLVIGYGAWLPVLP